ncbi:hypothetical protein [Pseudomonas sp.]|jgi:hypothetical protein|uniref:hypothetical protein n=1 Tax=Pseudomonas sp. TaxID=306 RepID=UPI002EDB3426
MTEGNITLTPLKGYAEAMALLTEAQLAADTQWCAHFEGHMDSVGMQVIVLPQRLAEWVALRGFNMDRVEVACPLQAFAQGRQTGKTELHTRHMRAKAERTGQFDRPRQPPATGPRGRWGAL